MIDRARPGLVAFCNIWPGNGAGLFLLPWSPHGANVAKLLLLNRTRKTSSRSYGSVPPHLQRNSNLTVTKSDLDYTTRIWRLLPWPKWYISTNFCENRL